MLHVLSATEPMHLKRMWVPGQVERRTGYVDKYCDGAKAKPRKFREPAATEISPRSHDAWRACPTWEDQGGDLEAQVVGQRLWGVP